MVMSLQAAAVHHRKDADLIRKLELPAWHCIVLVGVVTFDCIVPATRRQISDYLHHFEIL
jgi:hypothetical protein